MTDLTSSVEIEGSGVGSDLSIDYRSIDPEHHQGNRVHFDEQPVSSRAVLDETSPLNINTVDEYESIPKYYTDIETNMPERQESIMTRSFTNIIIASLVMMFTYASFFPAVAIQETVISDSGKTMSAKVGFFSQGIVYISSISVALCAPAIIGLAGNRITLFFGSLMYSALCISILILDEYVIYIGSAITGFGMGLLWVVAPKIVTDNSTTVTLQRNQSLFWCIYMMSMVLGNLVEYFYLGGLTVIESHTRIIVYSVCCVISIAGAFIGLAGIRNAEDSPHLLVHSSSIQLPVESYRTLSVSQRLEIVYEKVKITLARPMVWFLLVVLIYNGSMLSFYTMTVETCIGATFTQRKIIPLASLVVGVMEVLGALAFEKIAQKIGNGPSTILLFIIASCSLYFSFLIFPSDSTYSTIPSDPSMIDADPSIVLFISALIGISDAGFNILANTYVGKLFQGESEIGFTVLNVTMSMTTGCLFFLSPYLSLYALLALMETLLLTATLVMLLKLNNCL